MTLKSEIIPKARKSFCWRVSFMERINLLTGSGKTAFCLAEYIIRGNNTVDGSSRRASKFIVQMRSGGVAGVVHISQKSVSRNRSVSNYNFVKMAIQGCKGSINRS